MKKPAAYCRAAIYCFTDKDGIVDDYIVHQLKELKENVGYILFVAPENLTPQGKKKVMPFANDILCVAYGANVMLMYHAGMEFVGWDKLKQYGELVLMSDEMFGPVYPLQEVFDWSEKAAPDFWGIIRHYPIPDSPFGTTKHEHIPEHIRSFFLSIRQPLLSSEQNTSFWSRVAKRADTASYEIAADFTKTMESSGYSSDVYVNTEHLKGIFADPLAYAAKELLESRRCPFFAPESFTSENPANLTGHTFGEHTPDLIRFIQQKTDYDMGMVWQNVLRTANMFDIHRNAQLTRILPKHTQLAAENTERKVLLVIHSSYEDHVDFLLSYAKNMPEYCDILITTASKNIKGYVEKQAKSAGVRGKITVSIIENRGRDISALLIGSRDYIDNYDLVFFLHDKKSTTYLKPPSIGLSWEKKCFENLISSTNYIENIMDLFDKEPNLGMAFPPPPYNPNNHFVGLLAWEWSDSYDATESILKDFKIRSDYTHEKAPIASFGTMFVFRPVTLRHLFAGPNGRGWRYEDFPKEPVAGTDGTIMHGMERAFPFFVQDAGYYVAWLLNDEWAGIELGSYFTGWLAERKCLMSKTELYRHD